MGGEPFSEIHVSSAGLVRVDLQNKTLLGIDSKSWMACMASCGATDLGSACVPYSFPASLSFASEASCTLEVLSGEPWHGRETKVTRASCGGSSAEIRWVPSLRVVRDALVAVGFIAPSDGLATLDGFAISLEAEGREIFSIDSIDDAPCASFSYPAGYRVFGERKHFEELRRILPALTQAYTAAAKGLVEKAMQEAMAEAKVRMTSTLGEQCLGKRERYDDAEVEACLRARPEMQAKAQGLMKAAMEPLIRLMQSAAGPVMKLVETEVDKPLCEHFTTQARE